MGKAEEMVKRYVELYNDITPEKNGSDRFLEILAPNVDWREFPTRRHPSGRSGNREIMREILRVSRKYLVDLKMELAEIIEEGLVAAWAITWSATIGIDGLEVPRGSRIRIYMAGITEVRDNLIVRQHEYLTEPEII